MARIATFLEFQNETKERADVENDPHISASELKRYVNQSITKLYNKLVAARGDTYYGISGALVTVAGTATVALPAAFFRSLGLQWNISTTERRRIDRIEFQEFLGLSNNSVVWSRGQPVYHFLQGGNIHLWPTPNSVFNLTLWYIPVFIDLVNDGDTFDGINGWEDYVVIDAAIKVKIKREEDIRELLNERAEMEKEILALSGDVDMGQAARVIDVDRRRYLDPNEFY